MKRAQAAIEFVLLTAVMLLFFAAAFTVTQSIYVDTQEERMEQQVYNMFETLESEFQVAHQIGEGYERSIRIPLTFSGLSYDIYMNENQTSSGKDELIITVDNQQWLYFLNSPVNGTITKGWHTIYGGQQVEIIPVEPPKESCIHPADGSTFSHGDNQTYYELTEPPSGQDCADYSAVLVCNDGELSPSPATYNESTCSGLATCTLENGTNISHGATTSELWYSQAVVYGESCSDYARTLSCDDGTLSPSGHIYETCVSLPTPIEFVNPTPANGSTISLGTGTTAVAVRNTTLTDFVYTVDGTDVSLYDSSLVVMYNFDNDSAVGDTSTTVADVSTNDYDGTINGASWTSEGIWGGALQFNGVDSSMTTGQSASDLGIGGSSAKTISAWVYTEDFNNGGVFWMGDFFTQGEDFSLRTLSTDNAWRGQFWGAADIDFTYDSLNKWVHFIVTFDGVGTKIYADGSLVAQNTTHSVNTGDTHRLQLGVWEYSTFGGYFDGRIDEFRVYNRAVDAFEAEQLYLSNLKKINDSAWDFTSELKTLSPESHTIQATSNVGQTEERTFEIQGSSFYATGGEDYLLTDEGTQYRVHVFRSSGSLDVTGSGEVEYLVVGGGGGGAGADDLQGGGGGGGAGGFLTGTTTINPGSYTITVGAGGAGTDLGPGTSNQNGEASSFHTFTADGGGRGAGRWAATNDGGPGGSGGGAHRFGVGGTATLGQGSDGGNGPGSNDGGGGGGASDRLNGDGTTESAGGLGGGGNGASDQTIDGSDATPNTGGGGGGGAAGDNSQNTHRGGQGGNGGDGGSGIVIIRYPV